MKTKLTIVPDPTWLEASFTVEVSASPGVSERFAPTAEPSLMLTLQEAAERWARTVCHEMFLDPERARVTIRQSGEIPA